MWMRSKETRVESTVFFLGDSIATCFSDYVKGKGKKKKENLKATISYVKA